MNTEVLITVDPMLLTAATSHEKRWEEVANRLLAALLALTDDALHTQEGKALQMYGIAIEKVEIIG